MKSIDVKNIFVNNKKQLITLVIGNHGIFFYMHDTYAKIKSHF
jgi:hypothetical protein